MAFAMQLAAKRVSLDQCPHVSEEAKAKLDEASAPPMRLVRIGKANRQLKIGQETVLFRHQEKFHNPSLLAIKVREDLPENKLDQEMEKISNLKFIRVGEEIGVNLVALEHTSDEPESFAKVVKRVMEKSALPLILVSEDPRAMEAALKVSAEGNPLLYAANKGNWEEMADLAKQHHCPLVVKGETLEDLADLTQKIKNRGTEDMVLNPDSGDLAETLAGLTKLRRLVLEKNFRPLGYPTMVFTHEKSPFQEVAEAATYVSKYGGIVVMEGKEKWQLLPLLTVRQNIYTDPQVPNTVEAKLYEIRSPGADSPVLVTTNFSLTYFTVEGEVENSKVPSFISVVDTEGLGVLNAYAGDKWSAEKITKTLEEQKVKEKVNHNKIIIPGLVAVFRAEIEEESPWQVIIGPEEASRIPSFLRKEWKT
jgi:acetyl-CoA decarbonylase/synthase complex subunit gamma